MYYYTYDLLQYSIGTIIITFASCLGSSKNPSGMLPPPTSSSASSSFFFAFLESGTSEEEEEEGLLDDDWGDA